MIDAISNLKKSEPAQTHMFSMEPCFLVSIRFRYKLTRDKNNPDAIRTLRCG